MKSIVTYVWNRLQQRLWFRPLVFCLIAVGITFLAQLADRTIPDDFVPELDEGSVKWLLDTIASSMLVISIFAVTSMLSAFSAAQNTATPRSFKVVIADDVSQNALSVFISAFIFGIVASVALDNGYYGKSARFTIFIAALVFFALIILVFIRWVDRISRLGRLEHTIIQIEKKAARSLTERIEHPTLLARAIDKDRANGTAIFGKQTGYVQNADLDSLQKTAEECNADLRLNALPGSFVHPHFPLVYVTVEKPIESDELTKKIEKAFSIEDTRDFVADPRFGLIALSEIASRALSPGINDPGTAIQIIGSLQRLFFKWIDPDNSPGDKVKYDRIEVPDIPVKDYFDDAFTPIARDGAGNVEVMVTLQKAFAAMHQMDVDEIKSACLSHSQSALRRAENAMTSTLDFERVDKKCIRPKGN